LGLKGSVLFFCILVHNKMLFVAGCQLSVVGYRLSVVGS